MEESLHAAQLINARFSVLPSVPAQVVPLLAGSVSLGFEIQGYSAVSMLVLILLSSSPGGLGSVVLIRSFQTVSKGTFLCRFSALGLLH